jgi:hypothetical protein
MPLFNKIDWRGIGTTVVVEILVLLALAVAVVRYVEWSSDVAFAEFMSATKPSASDPNRSGEFSTATRPVKGRSACPRKG